MENTVSEITYVIAHGPKEVAAKINEFKNNGWNINNFFLQVVPWDLEGFPEFAIFYDSKLAENPFKKKE